MGRCQNGLKENAETHNGVADYFQRKKGRDDEVVFFSGDVDQGAATYHKRMKIQMENLMCGALGSSIML
jgi:hypothetical protein